MRAGLAFNLAIALATIAGAIPLMAQTDSVDEGDCKNRCDPDVVCCSTVGFELCCSYNVHQCCHTNVTTCYTSSC